MGLSATVVVEAKQSTEPIRSQSREYTGGGSPGSPRLITVLPLQKYPDSLPDKVIELPHSFADRSGRFVVIVPSPYHWIELLNQLFQRKVIATANLVPYSLLYPRDGTV